MNRTNEAGSTYKCQKITLFLSCTMDGKNNGVTLILGHL